jgi:outer membrane protein TolC
MDLKLGLSAAALVFAVTASTAAAQDSARRITLEQVKQSVNAGSSPLARLGQLQIEAAKQHRLGVQADYFPKIAATFVNLHLSDFPGEILRVRRPLAGVVLEFPVPLISQDLTIAAVTFVQPITPLFVVREAVRIARADERIAMAKAGLAVARRAREAEIEETYLRLLIAQRQAAAAGLKLHGSESRTLYAAASVKLARVPDREAESVEAVKELASADAKVRDLSAAINRALGWPDDTELELAVPEPLVEDISLKEIADRTVTSNPDVVEAEQTVVKARAASRISKLAYVPTVAAVGGYLFQNAIPALNRSFGYGGVMASYTLFDFGKREHAVREAHAQLEMAELALQMTKAKAAASARNSYSELERARQLSRVTQKMGASVTLLMNVSATSESEKVKAARIEVELEMIEADLAHRQAFARLQALVTPR